MDKKKKNTDKKKFKQFCYVLWHFLKNVLPWLSLVAFWNNELSFLCAQFSLALQMCFTDYTDVRFWKCLQSVYLISLQNNLAKKRWDNIFKNFFQLGKLRLMEVEVNFPRKHYKDTTPCQLVFSSFLFVASLRL